jgi:hypothetical protein
MQDYVARYHRRWANRAVAREVDRDGARRLWVTIGAMVLAAAPFAAYLLEQNECLRLSYEAAALRERRERLVEQERRLRMERVELQSLERIESWATGRHGLVRPLPHELVVVRREPAVPDGVAASATGGEREDGR